MKRELIENHNILKHNQDQWCTLPAQVEALNHFKVNVLIRITNKTINDRLRKTINEAVKTKLYELSENSDFITRVEKVFTGNRRINEYLNTQINTVVTTAIQTNLESIGKEQIQPTD